MDWVQICSMTLKITNCYPLHKIVLWPMSLILYFKWFFYLSVAFIWSLQYKTQEPCCIVYFCKKNLVALFYYRNMVLSTFLDGFHWSFRTQCTCMLFHHISDYTFPHWRDGFFYLYCRGFYTVVTWFTIQHNLC